ncbi:MAG: amino acid adenylation domain-containing protein, partial [bacterium]|nr:amino acid adenylation domain-containing protein [bacterium]
MALDRMERETDVDVFRVLVAGLVIMLMKYSYSPERERSTRLAAPAVGNGMKVHLLDITVREHMPLSQLLQAVKLAIGKAEPPPGEESPLPGVGLVLDDIHADWNHWSPQFQPPMVFSFSRPGNSGEAGVEIQYNASLYERTTVKRILRHFNNLLMDLLSDWYDDPVLSRIEILSDEDKNELLLDFNDTDAHYPDNKLIHELFRDQVERYPHRTALVFEEKILTYRQLDYEANRTANYLYREKGTRTEEPVGILMEQSLHLIITLLGILKAGAVYLPIEPGLPENRIKLMIRDASIGILMSQQKFINPLKRLHRECDCLHTFVCVDSAARQPGEQAPGGPLHFDPPAHTNEENKADRAAYVIYTSGSTGKPKGVVIPHRGIASVTTVYKEQLGLHEEDRVLQFAAVSFDASVWEITMALLTGAALCLADRSYAGDISKFTHYLNASAITVAFFSPPYLKLLGGRHITGLRLLMTGGSAAGPGLVEKWRKKVRYINAYGPTESTILATFWEAPETTQPLEIIPIGSPLNNIKLYILGNQMELLPIGVPGELCIAGLPLARGYLNRPELTAEKFTIGSPCQGVKARLYRTGDLTRWLPDGNIEFLGRIDFQVKVRGFRIEPGEIENRILEYNGIKEALVVAWGKGEDNPSQDTVLCAYIVPRKEIQIDVPKLREFIAGTLPDYMIPSYVMGLDAIPLSASGKVDRKKLPAPSVSERGDQYVAPETGVEKKLTAIWAEILHMDRHLIGIHDNFFQLGGHSLKAAMMITGVHKNFEVRLPISMIFKTPDIKSLSRYIRKAKKEHFTSIQPAEKKE